MKHLLNPENLNDANKIKQVKSLAEKFIQAYSIGKRTHISEDKPYARVFFNGVTRVVFEDNEIFVVGFGFEKCPDAYVIEDYAIVSKIYCVKVKTVEEVVNLLAKYEKIYPLI